MRHRHLDESASEWSVASVASVLERGGASDIIVLLRALRRDPDGPVADLALEAAARSDVYGYPALVRACLERWRHD